ncbi:glycosyltransferase [Bacillus sp. sid0103]|uniref:glycosyltransferase family 2 protein n=1 Tax=Bacillus sp. sid0103 TaxID=2856337 RepID=UPI001C43F6C4|nr:glycosyltransferase family 2 protein [Bacillus sp. sid0103]MBV7508966.1 glycosyltransferase [Bacillus sp. sid0103]
MTVLNVSLNSLEDLEDGNTLVAQPIVSVIVATYRRDTTLETALVSLMRQTYEHVEIVVVDDNAEEIWNKKVDEIICSVNKKFDRQLVYIKNKVNKGSAETRNIGIRTASGEYITFLDDDDIYLPEKVEKQVLHMQKEQSDFCITDLELYNENNKLVEKRIRDYIKRDESDQLLKYHLMYHMTGTDTFMFRKIYLLRLGGFPPINVGDEYYLMQLAIEYGGKFSYLPGCEIKAYIHSETDGLSIGMSKIKGENILYKHKMQFFDKLTPSEKRYINMRHYAVLAFAELRNKNMIGFVKNSVHSLFCSPLQCLNLLINRKR